MALLLFGIAHLGRHIVFRAPHALLIAEKRPRRRELAGHGAFGFAQRVQAGHPGLDMFFAHLGRPGKAGAALREKKSQLAQIRPVGDLRRGRKAPLHVQPGQKRFYLQSSAGIELLFHRAPPGMPSHLIQPRNARPAGAGCGP